MHPSPAAFPATALLTNRDLEILGALTKRVRCLSLPQIARTWWQDSANAARVAENRLRILARQGLIEIERAPAHPEIELLAPVATWRVGEPEPKFGAVSYQLKSRWRSHPVLTSCVSASKIAVNRFGGYGGRPPRLVERTHDIHMAQVFLFYRLRRPDLIRFWVFEEQVKAERRIQWKDPVFGEKLPDVILRSPAADQVIEFGGAYGKDKLVTFHRYCTERSLAYEIW
jgi:hypothetical protein